VGTDGDDGVGLFKNQLNKEQGATRPTTRVNVEERQKRRTGMCSFEKKNKTESGTRNQTIRKKVLGGNRIKAKKERSTKKERQQQSEKEGKVYMGHFEVDDDAEKRAGRKENSAGRREGRGVYYEEESNEKMARRSEGKFSISLGGGCAQGGGNGRPKRGKDGGQLGNLLSDKGGGTWRNLRRKNRYLRGGVPNLGARERKSFLPRKKYVGKRKRGQSIADPRVMIWGAPRKARKEKGNLG